MSEQEHGRELPGFIEPAEATYYQRIVRSHYRGDGCIVDAGCFIGASTRALSEGLPGLAEAQTDLRPIIALDRFTVGDRYVGEYLAGLGLDIRYGESFLPAFLANMGDRIGHVEVRAGDLLQVGRIERPIEILVVDLAKTAPLNAFVFNRWFPRLLPGHSLIVQQDFYSPTQPWIAVGMGCLLDYVSVEHDKVGESAIFRLERPVPRDALHAATVGWDRPEGLWKLDRMIEVLGDQVAAPLRLMRAVTLHGLGKAPEARRALEQELALHPTPTDAKWDKWLTAALVAVMPDIFDGHAMLGRLYWTHGAHRLGHG